MVVLMQNRPAQSPPSAPAASSPEDAASAGQQADDGRGGAESGPVSEPPVDSRFTWAAPGLWAMLAIHLGALLAFLPAAAPTTGILLFAGGLLVVDRFQ